MYEMGGSPTGTISHVDMLTLPEYVSKAADFMRSTGLIRQSPVPCASTYVTSPGSIRPIESARLYNELCDRESGTVIGLLLEL